MRFALRYWTRRSAVTVALPCDVSPEAIRVSADCLRRQATEHGWAILGEAFLRLSSEGTPELHLPVELADPSPCAPLRVGHVDHGHVVGAHEVPQACVRNVSSALVALLGRDCVVTGTVEFHFDPSVGRTEGIVVVPVDGHPQDKAAFVAIADPRTP